jgi:hypothetical protein
MSETQAIFDYSPGHASAIEASMTPVRMAAYLAASKGDPVKALRLYERNTLLSEAFYSPLQTVEIVIRNAFHKQLLNSFGPQWYDSMSGIFDFEQNQKLAP